MQPVIALVGRPNVGKSTLFNKLTRTQDALVADFPGLTRDRQYGDGRVGGWPYIVIDTGGLSGEPETLDAAMAGQTIAAIDEADLVVFLVDGRQGLNPVDEDIADTLRRHSDKVVLCVNKIDGIGEDKAMLDFYALGFENTVAIAASHNRGMVSLMEEVAQILSIKPDDYPTPGRYKPSDSPSPKRTEDIRIAFVGRPNVGKSTLINRLIGEDRVIAYDQPGTTRDAVAVPFERAGKQYTLIDTAGVRRRGKVSEKVEIFSIIKSMQSVDKSNVCVMLVDANDGFTDQDLHLLGYIIEKGRALIVAVNKWDSLDSDQRDELKESLERRVEFLRFTRIHFISALQGSGVGDLFKSINKAYASAFMDMATPRLTRLLEVAIQQHQPPMVNGRRIKLRYAHQGGVNPPVIVVHGNQSSKVPASYQRYLMNYFTKALRLFGTPLRIEFKQGDNPFAGRKTKRTSQGPRNKPDSRSRGRGK
jgi:GTP-binding protein